MPTITGNVSDVLGIPLPANRALRLRFELSDLGVNGQYVFITKPIYVTPDTDGSFSVNLIATGLMRPGGLYYKIAVEWLDSALGMPDVDYLPWKLFISDPLTGGPIGDFLQMPIRPDQVWVVAGTTPPDQSKPRDLLFDTNTSNLYRL